jgi:RNA polymerase sigma factor (sigma-70 family)
VLTAPTEISQARRIEAGWYAEHLLSFPVEAGRRDALLRVVADGSTAWQEAFTACLRLVRRLSLRYAARVGYDAEDTFQAGCVTLAKALQTWDYRGEARLITYVWQAVERGVRDYCSTRGGRMEAPAAVIRAGLATPDQVAWRPPRLIGDLGEWEEIAAPETADGSDLLTEVWPRLSPLSARVLAARYGLGQPRQEATELAERLKMSVRALRRVERLAEAELRHLLRNPDAVAPDAT